MIRYYTYYSCGGYKDIYIGSDEETVSASYFIPLLNVWKKNNKPDNAEKITRAESVQHVELITKSNSAGFPAECNLMFSHGGYNAMYRTLRDGRVCLCIRDIPNGTKDEEGRDIPFVFMFLADGKESIQKLDGLALEYLSRNKDINGLIADTISYDHIINGVKFDLTKLNILVSSHYENTRILLHKPGIIDYLKIVSRHQESMALKEQSLDARLVKSIWDFNGVFSGSLQYREEQSEEAIDNLTKQVSTMTEGDVNYGVTQDTANMATIGNQEKKELTGFAEESDFGESGKSLEVNQTSEISPIIEFRIQQLEQKLSLLAKTEDVEKIRLLLENISENDSLIFNNILNLLSNLQGRSSTKTNFAHVRNKLQLMLKNKFYLISIGCLIFGFVLGALIF